MPSDDMSMPETPHPADLRARFEAYVRAEDLFTRQDALLLAVSGGLDSVVLLDLVHRSGFAYQVAHANFGLRGAESDRDERRVRDLALRYGATLHVKRFDTAAQAAARQASVQETARELRYAWFGELLATLPIPRRGGRPRTVTAHHLDDNIETMLFHLFRGTGIAGLRGMLPAGPLAAHPLLFATRASLETHAKAQGLEWVDDSSNARDDYDRNFIRLRVLPLLEERFPRVRQTLADNLERFREAEVLHDIATAQWRKRLLQPQPDGSLRLPVEGLRRAPARRSLLRDILVEYGFSARQTDEVLRLLDAETGRYVASATHRVLRDRAWLSISRSREPDTSVHLADPDVDTLELPTGVLSIRRSPTPPGSIRDEGPCCVHLDARDIRYPLLVRRWRPGDHMYPLGMRKMKKVARILIDQRVPRDRKDTIWVVESDRRILWLIGIRIDDRFRVSASTRAMLTLRWSPAT
jgi:tRNA(Ile)-lysidine synthase